MINEMMQSLTVFKVGTWITVIFTILLIILLFMKTSRDERTCNYRDGKYLFNDSFYSSREHFSKNIVEH